MMKSERWLYIGIIIALAVVVEAQMTDVKWNRQELHRTIRTANRWIEAAKASCDANIQGWGNGYDPHLTEY